MNIKGVIKRDCNHDLGDSNHFPKIAPKSGGGSFRASIYAWDSVIEIH